MFGLDRGKMTSKKGSSRLTTRAKRAVLLVLFVGYFFGEPIPNDIDAKWVLKPLLTLRNLAHSTVSKTYTPYMYIFLCNVIHVGQFIWSLVIFISGCLSQIGHRFRLRIRSSTFYVSSEEHWPDWTDQVLHTSSGRTNLMQAYMYMYKSQWRKLFGI